jgi:alkanesulfonate monooxygenase SsuD/methylene tetrahydromethanopterin reductase-like flavin-dependent oxidoreductase (luciferase family)
LIAQAAATVDRLPGGRVSVGVGAAWNQEESVEAGLHCGGRRERLEQVRAGPGIVRRLLDGGPVTKHRSCYAVENAPARTPTAGRQRPPWFTGRSERLPSLVVDLGDGCTTTTNTSLEDAAQRIARLSGLLPKRGRAGCEAKVAASFITRVAEPDDATRRDVEEYIERGAFTGFIRDSTGRAPCASASRLSGLNEGAHLV